MGLLFKLAHIRLTQPAFDKHQIDQNPFFCGDAKAAQSWEGYLDEVRKSGSSAGAILEIVAKGIPAGLGQPLYGKLDAEIASAMMSINAVKGVEIGSGFDLAAIAGTEAGDEMRLAMRHLHSHPIMLAGYWAVSRLGRILLRVLRLNQHHQS